MFYNEAWVRRERKVLVIFYWHCLVGATVSLCVVEECKAACMILLLGHMIYLEKSIHWDTVSSSISFCVSESIVVSLANSIINDNGMSRCCCRITVLTF